MPIDERDLRIAYLQGAVMALSERGLDIVNGVPSLPDKAGDVHEIYEGSAQERFDRIMAKLPARPAKPLVPDDEDEDAAEDDEDVWTPPPFYPEGRGIVMKADEPGELE